MSEGGLGSKLENFRNKLPFLRRKTQQAPAVSEPEPESTQVVEATNASTFPQPVTELRQPEDYRQKAARDILGSIATQAKNGKTEPQLQTLLQGNPLLAGIDPKEIQDFLVEYMPQDEPARKVLISNQQAIGYLTQRMPGKPTKDEKLLHKKWVYENLTQPNSMSTKNVPIASVIREIEEQPKVESKTTEPRTPRKLIIEGIGKPKEAREGDIQILLDEIEESGAGKEIPVEDILELVGYLRVGDQLQILQRFKPEMVTDKSSSFHRYWIIKKGNKGTVLYFIDKENVLHLRLGQHNKIYDSAGASFR